MRISWYSNGPDTPTGYGTQTAQVTRRIKADGHEVHIQANYGQIAGVRDWDGIAIWPQGVIQYGLDVVDDQAKLIGAELVITLYDVWVMRDHGMPWKDYRVLSWTPVDHWPPPPKVLAWASKHETIAMSEFGAEGFRAAGIEPVAVIPHAIEDVFRPTASDVRQRMGIPDDGFMVVINAANIGVTPPRKSWGGNLEAVARFLRHHDDAYLYLHTDLYRPGGMPLQPLIRSLGIPKERIMVPPPMLYRGALVDAEELALIYSAAASDGVLLGVSKGEGFGIPTLEGMGCGLPSIVSDFTASPEIVGDTGWKVPGQLDWDHFQESWFFTPFTHLIHEALEEAYAERHTEKAQQRSQACVERAEPYRADRVYAEKWKPLLDRVQAELHPPERKHKSNAAKRRARKAA